MRRYEYERRKEAEDELMHWGIKGMKWKKHKAKSAADILEEAKKRARELMRSGKKAVKSVSNSSAAKSARKFIKSGTRSARRATSSAVSKLRNRLKKKRPSRNQEMNTQAGLKRAERKNNAEWRKAYDKRVKSGAYNKNRGRKPVQSQQERRKKQIEKAKKDVTKAAKGAYKFGSKVAKGANKYGSKAAKYGSKAAKEFTRQRAKKAPNTTPGLYGTNPNVGAPSKEWNSLKRANRRAKDAPDVSFGMNKGTNIETYKSQYRNRNKKKKKIQSRKSGSQR